MSLMVKNVIAVYLMTFKLNSYNLFAYLPNKWKNANAKMSLYQKVVGPTNALVPSWKTMSLRAISQCLSHNATVIQQPCSLKIAIAVLRLKLFFHRDSQDVLSPN
jgi:hypothetical protein